MRKFLTCLCSALAVVLFLTPQAGAQIEFLGPPYEGVEGTQAVSIDEYIYDGGASTTSFGLTFAQQGSQAWIHHFERQPGNELLCVVSTTFGTPVFPGASGITPGQAFQVHVWSDPNEDGDPSDAVLLVSAASTVDGASIDTDVFQTLSIGPVALPPSFFIGAATLGQFPAPLDQTIDNGDAWIDSNGFEYDPNLVVGAFNIDDAGVERVRFPWVGKNVRYIVVFGWTGNEFRLNGNLNDRVLVFNHERWRSGAAGVEIGIRRAVFACSDAGVFNADEINITLDKPLPIRREGDAPSVGDTVGVNAQ